MRFCLILSFFFLSHLTYAQSSREDLVKTINEQLLKTKGEYLNHMTIVEQYLYIENDLLYFICSKKFSDGIKVSLTSRAPLNKINKINYENGDACLKIYINTNDNYIDERWSDGKWSYYCNDYICLFYFNNNEITQKLVDDLKELVFNAQ